MMKRRWKFYRWPTNTRVYGIVTNPTGFSLCFYKFGLRWSPK